MTAPVPPGKGWFADFLDATVGFLDTEGGRFQKQKPFAQQLASEAGAMAKHAIANPRQFLAEQIGPGNLVGGVAKAATRPALKRLLATLGQEGGATLEASGKPFAGSGYAVADPDLTTIVSTPKEMRSFLNRQAVRNALAAGRKIGKWTDPETGKTEINITDVLPTEKDAVRLAAQRGEQAVGHLAEGVYQGDIRNPHAPVNAVKELLAGMRTGEPMKRVADIPSTRGKQLAQAYENLPKNDPAAREAYDALNAEVAKQLDAIKKAGYEIEYVKEDPYKNSAEMIQDVRENKRLKVFATPEGGDFHPYMTPDQNNAFRAVHDFLAHAGGGNQFGPVGEENAYRVHASTLSRLAQRALASETRGQNSWVNFGPNAHLPAKERPFAEQKAALFPEELLDDYEGMPLIDAGPVRQQDFAAKRNDPIVAAAIRTPDGRVFQGITHSDAFDQLREAGEGGLADVLERQDSWKDLFVTKSGALIDRRSLSKELGRRPVSELMRLEPEQIVSAVARDPKTGKLYHGRTHADAIEAGQAEGADWFSLPTNEDFNQYMGFASNRRPFLSRSEAADLAKQAKQVRELDDPHLGLTSEDMTPTSEGGFLEDATGLTPYHPLGAPAVHTRETWRPTERGVFDRSPERGVPATEYREPRGLLFESEPRPKAGPTELAQQIATDPRVERRIVEDMEKGMGLGGLGWYGLLPIKRYYEGRGGPISFADFNQAGAAGSARTPTHNELTNASILLYAKRNGIPYEEARQVFLNKFPGSMRPTFMGMHGDIFERAQRLGYAAPSEPSSGALKIPNYYHDRMLGAKGVPLDTHEIRAIAQSLGITEDEVKAAFADAESYNLATNPYLRVAQRYGLHPDQVQASRWIGGGKRTGLKSRPKGDFVQTVEDGLLYTAQQRGLDESPRGLRSLWDAIAQGEDFFAPYGGEGGFPVYGGVQGNLF